MHIDQGKPLSSSTPPNIMQISSFIGPTKCIPLLIHKHVDDSLTNDQMGHHLAPELQEDIINDYSAPHHPKTTPISAIDSERHVS